MASCLDADSGLPKEMLCDAPSSAGDSHGNETADQPLEEGHKEMIEKPVALFEAVDGQVLIGPQLWMPAAKWIYVMKNTSVAKCCLEVARHLWTLSEAAERSLTGQQCRSIATAARKLPATPEKVEVMKNCLAYFVDRHHVPELPKDHRVAAVRKHLRSFFTEAARQGKRVRGAAAPRDTQTNELTLAARCSVEKFSHIAEPLTLETKADVTFKLEAPQADAFTELQRHLLSAPGLGQFDENAKTKIHAFASSMGLGTVHIQKTDGLEKVLKYASRSLSKAEANYSTTAKECLAIIWAMSKFSPYLYRRPFNIVGDQQMLCWLASLKHPSSRLA
ncbi:uncharacterized protein LOC144126513 [Amblyomma americanum]